MHPNKSQDERLLITFSDILLILCKSKRKIFYCAVILGALGAIVALMQPILYEAEGTFREKGIKPPSLGFSQMLILSGENPLGEAESEAASLMMSRTILSDVMEKLHLQGSLQSKEQEETLVKRVKHNLLLTWATINNHDQPILRDDSSPLEIQSLKYTGEVPIRLQIEFEDDGRYQVFHASPSKQFIGWGNLGEPFHDQALSFTLICSLSNPFLSRSFGLKVNSLADTTKEMAKALNVEPTKLDKSLLKIKYKHPNRQLGSAVVNGIMESYQSYSKEYHSEMAAQQFNYLSQRRDQLMQHLTHLMHKHAQFLTQDLYSSGFIESDKEMDLFATSQGQYKQKLLDNELEIKRLMHIEPTDFSHYNRYYPSQGELGPVNAIFLEMRSLKQQRETLEHERMLKSRLSRQQENPFQEYQGISLEVATELYRDYSKQMIHMESTLRQNLFFIRQIEDSHFEITSLSAELTDPISIEMIQKASQLVLNLRDSNNQSLREQERLKEELHLERTFLMLHLQQIVQLMERNKQLIDEKIFALQNVALELIDQRISLLEKNLQEDLQLRLHSLQQEKILIERQLGNIHAEMAQLPQKWVSEQLLKQEVETNHLIFEEIAKLVETKNISHNLEVMQSAPLDLSLSPVHPLPPHAMLWGSLGFLMGGCLGACFVLARSVPEKRV